ncbi:hypothetical protein SFC65_20025 [Priestia filamentosa]|uniref:hypothetical protein n=1 Tax=Priestia filamentosa TaxID=1402861 RepID=UPI00398261BA
MQYGVQYRDMGSAVHGVLVFDEKGQAQQTLAFLEAGEPSNFLIPQELENSIIGMTSIDYRCVNSKMELTYEVNQLGYVQSVTSSVEIINTEMAVDVYI